MIRDIYIANFVQLAHGVRSNMKVASASSQLSLSHSAMANLNSRIVHDLLILRQAVGVSKTLHLQASQLLAFTQKTFPRVTILQIIQYLGVYHRVRREMPIIANKLTLGQALSVDKSKAAKSTLTLRHAAALSSRRNNIVGSTLQLRHGATAYKPSPYFIQNVT